MLRVTAAIVGATLLVCVQCQSMAEMMLLQNMLGSGNRGTSASGGLPASASGLGSTSGVSGSTGSTPTGLDLTSLPQPNSGSNNAMQMNLRNMMLLGLSMDQMMEFYTCARVGLPMFMCMQQVQ